MANEPVQPSTGYGLPPTRAEQVPVSPPTEHWAPPTEHWTPAGHPRPPVRRRFPGWQIGLAAATAVLAVTVFLVVLLWPSNPGAPLDFQAFERTGSVGFDEEMQVQRARVDADQAYFVAEHAGGLTVVATDHDGAVAWEEAVTALTDVTSFSVTPDVVLVHGNTDWVSPPQQVVALDLGNGSVRWQRDFHSDDGWRVFADMIVFSDLENHQLLGLDPGTGDVAWDLDIPDEARFHVEPVLSDEDLAGSSRLGDTHDVPRRGDRVAVVTPDGAVRVVDIHTGNVSSQGQAITDAGLQDRGFAVGDRLFIASEGRIYRFDLTQLQAPPDILYVAEGDNWSPEQLVTCGEQLVCVLTDGGEEPEVVALHTDGSGEAWRREIPEAEGLLPVGDNLAVLTDEPDTVVLDSAGDQVLERSGTAVRLNSGNLLLFASSPGSAAATDMSMAGVSLGSRSADRHELGQVPDIRPAGCAWNEAYLACPTSDGAGIWRFAG